jgi:hypothetical protein
VLDFNLVAARWYLEELSGEEMSGIACQALELGYDGKNLRRLAGLSNPARRDAADVVDAALRELGVQAPIAKRDAALSMAKQVASRIIEGSIEPYGGACRIWLSYSHEAQELRHWSELAINHEVAAGVGGIEDANQKIIRAARNLWDATDFDATAARFQEFLKQNKYPGKIVWLMPEDAILSGKRFCYVRDPVPLANEVRTRRIFADGVACRLGVLMSTLCEMESSTYCFVWYPRRQEDVPQGIWPRDGSMKFSVKIESARIPGKPVKSSLMWAFLKYRHRKHQGLKDFLFT